MKPKTLYAKDAHGLDEKQIAQALQEYLKEKKQCLRKVLLIPPDFTRYHSNAGLIVQVLYGILAPNVQVDILPALGTHVPVSPSEWACMFGSVPYDRMLVHNWRTDVDEIGEVPGELVKDVSEGLMDAPIPVEINRRLLEPAYDLILSIGQVVPHEVVGMANYSKNIFVGCGGSRMISSSHMLGAFYGLERIMGKDKTPVRRVLDYAEEHFIQHLPLEYILTVTDAPGGHIRTHGLFMGRQRKLFEEAVALAQKKNIIALEKPIKRAVVLLDEKEFKSTWLGNKAVYRTRMAIKDDGDLIVLAPGVDKFGEDKEVDKLIRKYGYKGREYVLKQVNEQDDLQCNLSAAAHLIHGSSDGRFSITYCTRGLPKNEVESVGYGHMPYDEAIKRYSPDTLTEGYNTLADGEEIFYISNPALGLWMDKSRLG